MLLGYSPPLCSTLAAVSTWKQIDDTTRSPMCQPLGRVEFCYRSFSRSFCVRRSSPGTDSACEHSSLRFVSVKDQSESSVKPRTFEVVTVRGGVGFTIHVQSRSTAAAVCFQCSTDRDTGIPKRGWRLAIGPGCIMGVVPTSQALVEPLMPMAWCDECQSVPFVARGYSTKLQTRHLQHPQERQTVWVLAFRSSRVATCGSRLVGCARRCRMSHLHGAQLAGSTANNQSTSRIAQKSPRTLILCMPHYR